ncbi:MAG: YicC family protein [Gemmatimonadota bacterium]|nr:YicC family protein [Gemmatimonadota bacterium]MDQ8149450.1 YicC family protein [Gemmatimonadota bacterium]MDQ8157237.1 YicC family protein [Gemmatimonadota bacterium]MDQ8177110.1 YicC family protein [Gemmatimonadota bacterium]
MTGFGTAEGPIGGSRVSVELRSVNHRFFNPSIKLPTPFLAWEGEVRELLRQRIARGHVTVFVRIDQSTAAGAVAIDEARFAWYATELRRLQQAHGVEGSVDVGTILRLPEVVRVTREEEVVGEGTAAELLAVVEGAVAAMQTMRANEGARLAAVVGERLALIEAAVARIAARAPERLAGQRQRLQERVAELTGGVGIDPQRLAHEVVLLADKLDVGEELDRFAAHIAAFRETLQGGATEPVGKRLGFLLQELLREANTTGSKANDATMLGEVVAIKEELERIREQVENLE